MATIQRQQEIKIPLPVEKGLFADRPLTKIPAGGCSAVSNIVIKNEYLISRPGFDTIYAQFSANEMVYHIDRYIQTDGTVYLVAMTLNSATNAVKVYYWNAGGSAWVDITGAVALTGSLGDIPHSVNFNGVWYFTTGGNNNLYSWNGGAAISAVGAGATAPHPNPKIVVANASRLFLMNIEDGSGTRIPYRIDWSDFLNPSVYNGPSAAGSGSSRTFDLMTESDPIITGAVIRDIIYAFKERRIYASPAVDAPNFFQFMSFSKDIGCVASRSLKIFKDSALFLGDDNLYYLDGQNVKPVADQITSRIRTIFNSTYVNRATAVLDRQNFLYYLFLPKVSTDDLITFITFDLKSGGWTESEISNTNLKVTSEVDYPNGPWDTTILVGSEDQYIYEMSFDYTDDGGTSFTPSWTSGIINVEDLTEGKVEMAQLSRVEIESESGKLNVYITYGAYRNALTSNEFIGSLDLDGNHSNMLTPGILARYFQIRINYSDMSDLPEISKITLTFTPTSQKVG